VSLENLIEAKIFYDNALPRASRIQALVKHLEAVLKLTDPVHGSLLWMGETQLLFPISFK
jgi:hypothetical protein